MQELTQITKFFQYIIKYILNWLFNTDIRETDQTWTKHYKKNVWTVDHNFPLSLS